MSHQPIQFAYWVPNVSGGLVISNIPQRTGWDFDYNRKLAQIAEKAGFDYALTQIRFTAGYGADNQHESVSFSQALLGATEKLKVIAALLPGPWNPTLAAKQIATISHLSNARIAVNVVSGWFRGSSRRLVSRGWIMKSAICVQKSLFAACVVSGNRMSSTFPAISIAIATIR
ncbi:hypothetical protein ERHA55_28480 [Erwinia rhapontici]|nr:hypothetical protein ERHA55_28480 [Erwinia rhapontici]